jgi:hypothetical protein
MPVYDVSADNAMAFHPEYFDRAIANDSPVYNYYEWNAKHRAAASSNVRTEVRPLPGPTEQVDLSSSTCSSRRSAARSSSRATICARAFRTTSGRTRFSIDFRTVNIDDIRCGAGARNVDSHCTGSSIRDFISAADLSPMPDDLVALFNDGTETTGDPVYVPPGQAVSARA